MTNDGIQAHAEQCGRVIDMMRQRLGSDHFTKGQDVGFEITPTGRSVVHYGGVSYFIDDDELIAYRVRGGRAEFGTVKADGSMDFELIASLAPAGSN